MPCFPTFLVFHSSLKQPRSQSLALFSLSLSCIVSIPSIFAALRFPGILSCARYRQFGRAVPCLAEEDLVLPKEAIADYINQLSVICRNPSKSVGRLHDILAIHSPTTFVKRKREKQALCCLCLSLSLSLTLSLTLFLCCNKSHSLASLDGNGPCQAGRDPSKIRRG